MQQNGLIAAAMLLPLLLLLCAFRSVPPPVKRARPCSASPARLGQQTRSGGLASCDATISSAIAIAQTDMHSKVAAPATPLYSSSRSGSGSSSSTDHESPRQTSRWRPRPPAPDPPSSWQPRPPKRQIGLLVRVLGDRNCADDMMYGNGPGSALLLASVEGRLAHTSAGCVSLVQPAFAQLPALANS